VLISLYFFAVDYNALIKAETYIEKIANDKKFDKGTLQFAYHRALAHRINVFADATWGLLGGVITAVGIHGLVMLKQKD
jgi:3-dehydroquinate synthetase